MTAVVGDVTAAQEQADIIGLELWMAISGLETLREDPTGVLTRRRRRALNLAARRFQEAQLPEASLTPQTNHARLSAGAEQADGEEVLDAIRAVRRDVVDLDVADLDSELAWKNLESASVSRLVDSLVLIAKELDSHPELHERLVRTGR